jgi:hypothetical protein
VMGALTASASTATRYRKGPHNKPLHLTAPAPARACASRLVYRDRACRR